MKTFSIIEPKGAYKAWEWIRGQIQDGKAVRLTAELESEPISQERRTLLWACLDQLAAQVMLKSGLQLSSRQWHQVACQRVLGYEYVDIGPVSHMVALEPKRMTGEQFDAVCADVIGLCRLYDVDLRKVNNATGQLDGPSS
jgi:hypothetical protein